MSRVRSTVFVVLFVFRFVVTKSVGVFRDAVNRESDEVSVVTMRVKGEESVDREERTLQSRVRSISQSP